MIVDPVHSGPAILPATQATQPVEQADFSTALADSLGNVNSALQEADGLLQAYASGNDVAVHDLVISMEKARFSLQFAVEVRNRLVESYQEFMRMQV